MASVAGLQLVARVLLQVTAIAFVLSELSIRLRTAVRRTGARVDRGSVVAVVAGIAFGLLLAIWCAAAFPGATMPGGWWVFGFGIVLMWVGIVLREWAVWTLGPFFSVVVRVSDHQPVVDWGPYRWVRHPSYTGLSLTLLGLGFAMGNWLSVVSLAALPMIGLVIRIRVEERALLHALGEPYRKYAELHRRLIPGVW